MSRPSQQINDRTINATQRVVRANTTAEILEVIAAHNEVLTRRNSERKNQQHGHRSNQAYGYGDPAARLWLVFSHRKFMGPNWRLSRTTQLPLQLGIAPDPHGSGSGLLLGLTLHYPDPYNSGFSQDNATPLFGQFVRTVLPNMHLQLVRQMIPAALSNVFAG